ncbi:MAG: PadR family transcriptional regulator, partial [Promethearchaeota archaeon]
GTFLHPTKMPPIHHANGFGPGLMPPPFPGGPPFGHGPGPMPPPFPGGPPFGHGPGPMPPPFPFDRESLDELKVLFILQLLEETPDGITGYQLEARFKFPRTTILRRLNALVEQGLVQIEETTKEGRKLKCYKITEKGHKHLEFLKEKWTNRFALISEIAPPEQYANPFIRPHFMDEFLAYLKKLESKESVLDFVRGLRHSIRDLIKNVNVRLGLLSEIKNELDLIIKSIEHMDEFDIDAIRNVMKGSKERMVKKLGKLEDNPG